MKPYLQNMVTVLEVLIAKFYASEKYNPEGLEYELGCNLQIYDHDLIEASIKFATFACVLEELEEKKFVEVASVGLREYWSDSIPTHHDTVTKIIYQNLVHKTGVRFSVSLRGNVWRLLQSILQEDNIDAVNIGTTTFVSGDGLLYVNGKEIKLKLKNDVPGECYVMNHMMQQGLQGEYFFSEMIEEKVWDGHDQRAYFDACKNLNSKVAKQTKGTVSMFLLVRSGESGSVRVNPRYL